MDPARKARVGRHVLIEGFEQCVVHAGVEFAVSGHGRLLQGRQAVQHSADGRVLDRRPGPLRQVPVRLVRLVRMLLTRAKLRRQRGPSYVGRE
jgi:hypothetical protein